MSNSAAGRGNAEQLGPGRTMYTDRSRAEERALDQLFSNAMSTPAGKFAATYNPKTGGGAPRGEDAAATKRRKKKEKLARQKAQRRNPARAAGGTSPLKTGPSSDGSGSAEAAAPTTIIFRNKGGKTTLMIAAERGNIQMVKELVDFGDNAQAKDDQGLTALDYARLNNHTAIADFLLGLSSDGSGSAAATDPPMLSPIPTPSTDPYANGTLVRGQQMTRGVSGATVRGGEYKGAPCIIKDNVGRLEMEVFRVMSGKRRAPRLAQF